MTAAKSERIKQWPNDLVDRESQLRPKGEAYGSIQWKGTDVCIDIHCPCGAHSHIDAEFLYFFRCAKCYTAYAVGSTVRLFPLDSSHEQAGDPNMPTDEEYDERPCPCR